MNNYVLMLAAAGLIAAAPAYYAFQAQAEETGVSVDANVSAAGDTDTTASTSVDAGVADRDQTVEEGASRSPGSAPGESSPDASTSTDTTDGR